MDGLNLHDTTSLIALLPNASLTAATTNGTGVDVTQFVGKIKVIADTKNVQGTTPTLDIKLQESDTSGGSYTDIAGAAFTQVTTTAGFEAIGVEVAPRKAFIRAVATIGGTATPTYLVSVNAVGQKQVAP